MKSFNELVKAYLLEKRVPYPRLTYKPEEDYDSAWARYRIRTAAWWDTLIMLELTSEADVRERRFKQAFYGIPIKWRPGLPQCVRFEHGRVEPGRCLVCGELSGMHVDEANPPHLMKM